MRLAAAASSILQLLRPVRIMLLVLARRHAPIYKPSFGRAVETTICDEVRQARDAVVIDHVAEDEVFCKHQTPAMYGFQSYISMPIFLNDGSFYGTLCAIDPKPARLKNPGVIGMFRLFADLIAHHLDAGRRLATVEASLLDARAQAELREQFIAVLGHDLRNPLASIAAGTRLIEKTPLDAKAKGTAAICTGASRACRC